LPATFRSVRGAVEPAPVESWVCGESDRVFESKIGLGLHKHLAHPAIRNIECTIYSCPKEGTARRVHQQCRTEKEMEFCGSWINRMRGVRA